MDITNGFLFGRFLLIAAFCATLYTTFTSTGNGSLDAVSNALKQYTGRQFNLKVYTEHSVQEKSSGSTAAAYIGLEDVNGNMHWGAGTDTDIIKASAQALISAYNNMTRE